MKRILSWSLLKRLLPVLLIPVLLFSSIEVLPVVAGEAEPGVEEPAEQPNENEDAHEEEVDDEDDTDEQNVGDNNTNVNENNNDDKSENNPGDGQNTNEQVTGEEDKIKTSNDGTPVEGTPAEGELPEGEASINPEDFKGLLMPQMRNAKGMTASLDGTGEEGEEGDEEGEEEESEEVIISFDVTDPNNDDSHFEIFEGRYEPKNNEKYYPGGKTYSTTDVKKEDDKVSARVSFYYDIDEDYEVSSVSCEGAAKVEHNPNEEDEKIVCEFEDLQKGKNNYTIKVTVKKIDEVDPVIESVTVAEGTPTYECDETGNTAFSTESSNLSVTAKVTDDKGIDSVYVVAEYDKGEEKFEMNLGTEDTYTWTPEHHGNYKIEKVVAEDRGGNKVEYSAFSPKALCYYEQGEEDELEVSLQTGNGRSKEEEWHSTAEDGDLLINIDGRTSRKIQKIIVTGIEGEKAAESRLTNTKFEIDQNITVPNVEGKTEYKVSILFYGDTEAKEIDTKEAWIDNTAPAGEIKTEPSDAYEEKGKKHGHSIHNDNIDILIKVPAKCDHEEDGKEVSGFYSITYTVKKNDEEPKEYELNIHDRDKSDSNDEYIIFRHPVEVEEGEENRYVIKVVSISDAAGNVAECEGSKENIHILDKAAPSIQYSTEGIKREEGDYKFYSGEISGTVSIKDIDLDKESINFEPIEGKEEAGYTYLTPELQEEDEGKATYKFRTSDDGEYIIKTYAKDKAPEPHEKTEYYKYLILDNKDPEVEISYDKDAPSEGGDSFYNSNITATVKVTDKWLDRSSSKVTIQKTDQNGAQTTYGPFTDFSGDLGESEHTYSFTTDGDGEYKVIVEAIDMSGNHSEKEGAKFTVDSTKPEVTISFDNNDPMNEKYYNATRTATVTVVDYTFNEETAGLQVQEKYGTADISGWTQEGAFTYKCTVTFEKDGQYEISCQSEDKAHNQSEKKSEPEFVIDKTAPEIQVNYNAAEASNGNFYKDTRIASVNIKEISFDDKLVEITAQPLNEGGALPAVGGFSSSDDQNIASITFDEDGTYGYVVNCTDLAGNKAENYISDVFIIDKTAPEVTFSGVENYSANNAEVAPTVKYGDKYIDIDASSVTLRGSNNGIVTVGNSISQTEDGFMVSYSDFAHDKSMDDLYIMEAKVRDKAGNESNEQLIFSVNRHGSVFVVGDLTKALNDKYYTNEPKDVKVTEINIDTITKKDVSYTRDGDLTKLKNGDGYGVNQQGDDTSWKTYEYTVYNKNFKRDGRYSVSIYTEDKATNIQDNKSRDAEVTFAVDMTAPSIVTAGIKENEVYKETSHSFNYDVSDNMAIDKFVVYVDGKAVKTYDQDSIEKGEDMSLTLPESDDAYTITMIAEDLAGNREISVISGVLVSTKTDVKSSDPDDGLGHNNTSGNSPFVMQRVLFIILAGASVVSVGGAGVLLYRRKIK